MTNQEQAAGEPAADDEVIVTQKQIVSMLDNPLEMGLLSRVARYTMAARNGSGCSIAID
jgi:hypothetical protein